MEFKTIVYIILGIVYFLYSINKSRNEQSKSAPKANSPKPIEPPTSLKDILVEIQRRQQEEEAKHKVPVPAPPPPPIQKTLVSTGNKFNKEKAEIFEEGVSTTTPKKENREKQTSTSSEIYSIKQADETETDQNAFELNLRKAVIGSVILETKF